MCRPCFGADRLGTDVTKAVGWESKAEGVGRAPAGVEARGSEWDHKRKRTGGSLVALALKKTWSCQGGGDWSLRFDARETASRWHCAVGGPAKHGVRRSVPVPVPRLDLDYRTAIRDQV